MSVQAEDLTHVLVCPKDEHTHIDECYDVILTCEFSEGQTIHEHDENCYTINQEVVCELDETIAHRHNEDCYCDESLVCQQHEISEELAHTHNDACYEEEQILTCTQETIHYHTDSCYTLEDKPKCVQVEHTHSEHCYSNHLADLESPAIWDRMFKDIKLTGNWNEDLVTLALTQQGVVESDWNFIYQKDGTRAGYTRYADWYDRHPYDAWCASFCSFLMYYAGITKQYVPYENGVERWIQKLKELDLYLDADSCRYEISEDDETHLFEFYNVAPEEDVYPVKGNLIFFNFCGNGKGEHVGIVIDYDSKTHIITTIEGNYTNDVQILEYDMNDCHILGYGLIDKAYTNYCILQEKLTAKRADLISQEKVDKFYVPVT